MEQKKVQRIIGIVVVIALVVVVMPLILGKNDIPTMGSTSNSKSALPEQSATIASTSATATTTTADTISQAASSSETSATMPAEPANSMNPPMVAEPTSSNTAATDASNASAMPALPAPSALSTTKTAQQADVQKPMEADSSSNKPAPTPGSVIYEPVTTTPAAAPVATVTPAATVVTPEPAKPTQVTETASMPAVVSPTKPDASAMKIKQAVIKEKKAHSKSIMAVQAKTTPSLHKIKAGWVVQMGNFAVKKNAIHLANVLRAAGYKVFTRDVKTAKGKINTRVYIGPEIKQASATKLSNDIHHHMNMQGYVVSYKL